MRKSIVMSETKSNAPRNMVQKPIIPDTLNWQQDSQPLMQHERNTVTKIKVTEICPPSIIKYVRTKLMSLFSNMNVEHTTSIVLVHPSESTGNRPKAQLAQGKHAVIPVSGEKDPTGQGKHTPEPRALEKVPASHRTQVAWPADLETVYVPAEQSLHPNVSVRNGIVPAPMLW
jgi:hypothetical protein